MGLQWVHSDAERQGLCIQTSEGRMHGLVGLHASILASSRPISSQLLHAFLAACCAAHEQSFLACDLLRCWHAADLTGKQYLEILVSDLPHIEQPYMSLCRSQTSVSS
jgi:hypothetical protein